MNNNITIRDNADTGVKKINTTLYSLMFATSSTLLPFHIAFAEEAKQWECEPGSDYRSWGYLKDCKAPVETVPESVATQAQPVQEEMVTVTPLAQPEPIHKLAEPVQAPPEKPAPITVPIISAQSATEIPVEEPVLADDEPESEPQISAAPSVESTETQFEPTATPVEPDSISIDRSLPSCVAINNPSTMSSEQRRQLRETSATQIEADEATMEKDKQTVLSGNVQVTRADQSLQSDSVLIDRQTNQADASGAVIYDDSEVRIRAKQAHLDFDTDENSFAEATFTTKDRYSRGTAGQIQTQQGERLRLDRVEYTSCPPGDNAWLLQAEKITLDDVSGRGEARDVKVRFFDVPVFYSPYMTFPIDDRRQTGLLTPRLANSDDRGTEITAPIYWNIGPDRDATFYPRYMSKRGLQLGGEYRYLNDLNKGQVNFEYLGDDDKYTGRGDNDRWAFRYEHDATIFNNWRLDTKLRRVSDDQYFEDLGSSLTLSSQRYLESHLALSHTSSNWSAYGLLQDYQTVDRTIAIDPYQRLPHLRFDAWTDTFADGFVANIDTEYTHFDRDNSVTGKRTDIYPSITYNYDQAGYYIRPKFGVRYTHYSLSNQGTLPSSPSRSLPIFSIDSGLFYERESELFGQSMLQTLEPRLYYLNIPERNQTRIPIFDTGLYDFNSSTLFSENRFSGLDRIGDTNQLSVGVTSRFLDHDNGSEKLAMTLGQIYYFSNRDVTLPGGTRDDDDSSPIIAELRYHPYRKLVASALLHWDPESSETERTIYRMKYQPADDKVINLAYRHRKDFLKQTDVSFLWPMGNSKRWHAIGRWNHSLRHNKSLDTFAGVEYESCCWKTRFVARRWINDINSDYDTGIFFELELKGLGSIGDDVSSFLETGILGYDRHIKDEDDDTYYY